MYELQKKHVNYVLEVVVAIGYILFFCLLIIVSSMFYQLNSVHIPVINPLVTSLPPATPTPHISLSSIASVPKIFEDDFSYDQNQWGYGDGTSYHDIKNGKLIVESLKQGNYAIAACKLCPFLSEPYYLEADLSTDMATDEDFGIVFNHFYSDDNFYLFQINVESKKYYLYHHTSSGTWSLVMARESEQIKSFPASNTLGIYANVNSAEFYINGKIVDSYEESDNSFSNGYFGFYTNDSGFKLAVDNLTIYKAAR